MTPNVGLTGLLGGESPDFLPQERSDVGEVALKAPEGVLGGGPEGRRGSGSSGRM